MIVSHFELVFKPQSRATASPAHVCASDTEVRGYFLEISNLGRKQYQFGLDFVISPPDPDRVMRRLAGKARFFVENPCGGDRRGVLAGTANSRIFRPSTGSVAVPAGGTALVAVLPCVSALHPGTDVTGFEVRGYVRITLPALYGHLLFSTAAQTARPVRVRLTPQTRTLRFHTDGTVADQTHSDLPLGQGKAVYDLPPQPGGLVFTGFTGRSRQGPGRSVTADTAPTLAPDDQAPHHCFGLRGVGSRLPQV